MIAEDIRIVANRLLHEHNRKDWWCKVSTVHDMPIAWDLTRKILYVNPTKVTPSTVRDEILMQIADMIDQDMRGFNDRKGRHWRVLARQVGVKLKKKTKSSSDRLKQGKKRKILTAQDLSYDII